MRALAHPTRLRLIEELTLRGPMTATEAAAVRRGVAVVLLVPPPHAREVRLRRGGRGRHRPAAPLAGASGSATAGRPARDTPAAERTAGEALAAQVRRRDRELLDEFHARQAELPEEWTDSRRARQLRRLADVRGARRDRPGADRDVAALPGAAARPGAAPPGARLVHMFAHGFPRRLDVDPHEAPDA